MEIANIHEAVAALQADRAGHGRRGGDHRQGGAADGTAGADPCDESPRVGGQWKGRVRIADDSDMLPDEIAAAFGIEPPYAVTRHSRLPLVAR